MNEINLFCGDCIEIMQQIPEHSIDAVICDLPYGLTKAHWDKPIPFEPLWGGYERVCKEKAPIILFSEQPFTTDLINSARKLFRYEIIWEKTQKTGFYNANRMPLKGHENILVFYKKLPTYNPQKYHVDRKDIGRRRKKQADRCVLYGHVAAQDYVENGTRYPHDVIHFSNWNGALFGNNSNATKHPTQKPVPVIEWLIRSYTNQGDTVLDNCMGSGSTGVAAINTGRNFVGIELDKSYYQIAEKRIQEANEKTQVTVFDLLT